MKSLFLIFCCFIIPVCVHSQQQITGKVFVDNKMKVPLSKVKLKFYDSKGSLKGKTKTDDDGRYVYQLNSSELTKVVFCKKTFSSVIIDSLGSKKQCNYKVDIVFKKKLSLHDDEYNGSSHVVSSEADCKHLKQSHNMSE